MCVWILLSTPASSSSWPGPRGEPLRQGEGYALEPNVAECMSILSLLPKQVGALLSGRFVH